MTQVTHGSESVMVGHGFYSRHSQPQRAAARVADRHLVDAATAVPLPSSPTPLLIGDFGCAGGANEMAPIAEAIDAVRERDATVPVEVAHTDLPENDFGPLFALLDGPDGYPTGRTAVYPSVVGRTLYGPLFPDRRLHLGWSSITLHWLSDVPPVVPGRVYSNLLDDGPARDALAARSASDWRMFLTERARELVVGGELVVTGGASQPAQARHRPHRRRARGRDRGVLPGAARPDRRRPARRRLLLARHDAAAAAPRRVTALSSPTAGSARAGSRTGP